jgi:diguanylate cyclase (GGDEF)-like protein/PAS domain S-box-containing protein
VRGKPAPIKHRLNQGWTRRVALPLRLAGCCLFLIVAAGVVPYVESWWPVNNFLWVANGLFLAYLLLAPRWYWKYYFATGFGALSLRILFAPTHWQVILLYNVFDMVEVGVAALLLRPRSAILPEFTQRVYFFRFLLYGVVLGPAIAAALFATFVSFWPIDPQPHPFLNWMYSDSLGMATCAPAFVAVFRARYRNAMGSWKESIYPLLLLAVTLAAFAQNTIPLLYLIYPLLVLVLVRLGLGYAALSTLGVAAIAGWLTLHGRGPFAHLDAAHPGLPALNLQIAAASALILIYSVSLVLKSRDSIRDRLAHIASLHALVTENSRDAIILADLYGNRSYVSAAVERIIGMPPEEFERHKSLDLVHPDDVSRAIAVVKDMRSGADGATIECRVRANTGDYIWVEASLRVVRHPTTGAPSGILNIVRDVTERKRTEEMRSFQHSVIRAIYNVSLEGILVVNSEGYVVSYNQRFSELWGISQTAIPETEARGSVLMPDERLLSSVVSRVADPRGFRRRVQELYANPDAIDACEIELVDGRTLGRYSTCVRSDDGRYLGRVWFFRDISEHKAAQGKLEDAYRAVEVLAATDPMTGLANRRLFDQSLSGEWRRALRDHAPLSLLMIDADLFKSFNDTYGHMQGDDCLKMIADAAAEVVRRPGDLVARFGGEEFTVILPNTERDGALAIAEQISSAIRARGIRHQGNPLGIVTVSVGCATMFPALGWNEVNLIEMADAALYRAKGAGRNRVCADAESTFASTSPHIQAAFVSTEKRA